MSAELAEKRILIFRTGANGDILMSTPVLEGLRDAYPTAHITWVVEHSNIESIDANPYLDAVLCWNGAWFNRVLRPHRIGKWLWRSLQFDGFLRRGRYDLFLSYEPEQWRLLAMALRRHGASSVGVFDTWKDTHGYRGTSPNVRYYDHAYVHSALPAHRTDQALLSLSALDLPVPAAKKMTMGYTAADRASFRAYLHERGVQDDDEYVVVAPMTTWESRCWPAERYALLCDRLQQETSLRVVMIGSAREASAVEAIAGSMATPPVLATGGLSFRGMAALIGHARLVISGDTGPMHVAAAVGTPYLALFGSTPTKGRVPFTGPGRVIAHPVPCGPCDRMLCTNPPETFLQCMRLISVDEAYAGALELLAPS